MEELVRLISTSEGDVYHISLFEDFTLVSDRMIENLGDVRLVGIDLRRLKGDNPTNLSVLKAIEDVIAEVFLANDNIIVFYYCDFLNPIPYTRRNAMPPQEYRSRMFERMFQRYVTQKNISDIGLSVFTVEGIGEKYYFHLIHRKVHAHLARSISKDLKEGLSKPQS